MACSCVRDMQEKIEAKTGKRVICQNYAMFLESDNRPDHKDGLGETRTVFKAFLVFKVSGSRKKEDTMKIVLRNCPFCGEEY